MDVYILHTVQEGTGILFNGLKAKHISQHISINFLTNIDKGNHTDCNQYFY